MLNSIRLKRKQLLLVGGLGCCAALGGYMLRVNTSSGTHQHPLLDDPPALTYQEVNKILRKDQSNGHVRTSGGLCLRFSLGSVASNEPMEDAHFCTSSGDDVAFGVLDGHGGHTCAKRVATFLPNTIEIERRKKPENVPTLLVNAFKSLDGDLLSFLTEVPEVMEPNFSSHGLLPAVSGCCATLMYIRNKKLYFANTGDCRVVMGSKTDDGSWIATPVTKDQTATTFSEIERINAEHPGETATVLRQGRILGSLQPSRAFGDGLYKWTQRDLSNIPTLPHRADYLTPPYVTAEPDVTEVDLTDSHGEKFVVIASDGIWDCISNEKCIEFVGKCIDDSSKDSRVKYNEQTNAEESATNTTSPTSGTSGIPVASASGSNISSDSTDSIDIFNQTNSDAYDNAATMLIRHVLGPTHEHIAYSLSLKNPYCRLVRDDMTVTIVKFDDQQTFDKIGLSGSTGIRKAMTLSWKDQYKLDCEEFRKQSKL